MSDSEPGGREPHGRESGGREPHGRDPGRILIVSDAWMPQINGVVRTLATVADRLRATGHVVEVIGPDRFRTIPCPTYPEIRLALAPSRRLAALIEAFAPDALHVATEGPLGLAAARIARRRGWRFTTSYHTRFPDYLAARTALPRPLAYAWLRRFHGRAAATLVATESLAAELEARRFRNVRLWSRGVDAALFHPARAGALPFPRPIFLSVGRLAVEKNLPAFLDLDLPGTKLVVGDGPAAPALRRAYPDAQFLGALQGEALAEVFAAADVFVFSSRTDTFGLVLLEALASGLPVAAFPVPGPRDVLGEAAGRVGILDADLRRAALSAAGLDRAECRRFAERFSWEECAAAFCNSLVPLGSGAWRDCCGPDLVTERPADAAWSDENGAEPDSAPCPAP